MFMFTLYTSQPKRLGTGPIVPKGAELANYLAMHFSAKRGIAIACRLSLRPSVRLSVCL